MQRSLPLLLALAFAAPVGASDTTYPQSLESVLTLRLDGDIEIDANGRVLSHKLDTELPPAMSALIDKAVARWKFQPPTEDGKPLDRARSRMHIALVANEVEKDGKKGLVMKIENVRFPPPPVDPAAKPVPGTPSLRPQRLPKFNVPAEVMLTIAVQYDASGKVLDVAPSQCTVLALGRGVDGQNACEKLERNTVQAVRQWKIDLVPGGKEALASGAIGFNFVYDRDAAKRSK